MWMSWRQNLNNSGKSSLLALKWDHKRSFVFCHRKKSQILVHKYWIILDCFGAPVARSIEHKYHIFGATLVHQKCSGIATGGQGGAECHPWQQKNCQNLGKRGGKSGKKRKNREGKNREGSFTLPLLTDRIGYTTAEMCQYSPILGRSNILDLKYILTFATSDRFS